MTPEQLSNSTIYVTLEPCCHYGKQPPCTQLIIDSGIKQVVVGATDPHSLVTGKGIAALRQAGLEVSTGLLAKEASQLNDHYNYFYQTGLPYVTLKQAMTLDHMLAKKGERTAITGAEAWTRVHQAMRRIEEKGSGLILYLNQEGRGIGLTNKLRAYALQDQGHDTYDANLLLGFVPDERKYDVAAKMIKDLGIKQVQLLTNNPDKIKQLEEAGVEITDRLPLEMAATAEDRRYLETKRDRFKHMLVSL
ncbi:hypothetical protein BTI50_08885 [Lactobacillus delbrueckii subsp. bulgaricus]|nr:hypothetical protein [Lactobacillus delbrueckii subsp. bulgaricus]MBT8903580.1 hypothetical protein [Lactobacillus delbrueckii subsp. bulgaricus]MBT8928206.1 hypothetical protein [Lactobacillus delbrueckii subsp. bulgaricus]